MFAIAPRAKAQGAAWIHVGAQAFTELTEATAVPRGQAYGEARVTQPIIMVRAGTAGDRLLLFLTTDFEGLTVPNGVLTPGGWGEGFIDRRHPHTYVHELMVLAPDILRDIGGPAQMAVGLGKGFAPFGTDDPMSRPVERFPVNHHLSQILERAVGLVAVSRGPVRIEGSLFNGDEPIGPSSWPKLSRFGDSWSLRLTVRPVAGLEWQVSRAMVTSPEVRDGGGLDQSKWSTSLRWERSVAGRPVYAEAEWARTGLGASAYVLHSVLVEGEVRWGGHHPYIQFECSERPEDERTLDPYRLQRPIIENSILGITRWTIVTAGYGVDLPTRLPIVIRPYGEGSLYDIAKVGAGIFDPAVFYGTGRHWSVTVGVKLLWQMPGHRMGRYEDPAEMTMPRGGE